VENLNEENPQMVVELGPESLSALKRLAEAIEKLDPRVSDPGPDEEHPAPRNLGNAGEEGQKSEVIALPLAMAHPAETKQPQSPYLNAQEAAAYLRVSLKSLYSQVERGNLKSGRGPRRRLLFKKDMLDRYVQRRGLRA
jgi:excisionase family DNA binding protein